ncbi:DUF317 domain-containing protein [Streptomyces griseocarneus]|uniref:DUF317 domain-containing protein n=1 Tax=Streptomyces griseocarneus TaxID=51201 RepID=UPI00167CDECE|nr:DUF317 domain-containing protein [Streptomyces griseocarneus]
MPRTTTKRCWSSPPPDHGLHSRRGGIGSLQEADGCLRARPKSIVAGHEFLTLRALFDHDAEGRDLKSTVEAYEMPVGDPLWHGTATASTPAEVVDNLPESLATENAWVAARPPASSRRASLNGTLRPGRQRRHRPHRGLPDNVGTGRAANHTPGAGERCRTASPTLGRIACMAR